MKKLTFTLKSLKPRNPFVAAALRAPAGVHRNSHRRQGASQQLREELRQLHHERYPS